MPALDNANWRAGRAGARGTALTGLPGAADAPGYEVANLAELHLSWDQAAGLSSGSRTATAPAAMLVPEVLVTTTRA